jgi:hypothetical protein
MNDSDLLAVPIALPPVAPPPAAPTPAPADPAARLAELRNRKAAREQKIEAEKQAAELARLELEEKYEKELGPLGREFAIVDCSDQGDGFVVMKRGEDVLWNAFKASKMGVVDTEAFVLPCVVSPSTDDYRKLVKRRPFVADRCAGELATLFGVKLKADEKK